MRTLILALLALAPCCGCVIAVHDDGSAPPAEPAPAQPTPVVVVDGPASEAFALHYGADVPVVFEGIQKACARLNIRISDTDKPGSGNNWRVKGFHANGWFDFEIFMHRRDHKSQTTVTVQSGRFTVQQCREWTRKIHSEIGRQIGEDGRN
ncbi:MAG TPA: hypothetical protein VE981_16115 [Planctomycetota bacterium]|nr:hypothetical protein [Planctomycetota bacterium]